MSDMYLPFVLRGARNACAVLFPFQF